MGRWTHVESNSPTVLWFSFDVVPGLLQIEEYAFAILRDDTKVKARIARQQILTKEFPAYFVALIDESILRRNVGGPQVMRDQLNHLAEMAEQENIIIHIITLDSPVGSRYTGSIGLASYNGETEVGYTDDAISGNVIENAEEVTNLRQTFEVLRSYARNREESLRIIKEAINLWSS